MKRVVLIASLVTIASAGGLVVAQQNSAVPQPRADALPAPGTGSPKVSRTVPKPDGVMPTVPAGFTVTTYAELPTPRMMAYAPNGDLFVSSPAANTIVVLRDANNDGTFEACSVFAAGPVGGRGGRGGPQTPPATPPGCPAPLTNPNAPPAPPAAAAAPAGQAPAAPQRQGGPAPGGVVGGQVPPAGQAPAGAPRGGQRAGGPPPQGGGGPGGGRGGPSILGANAPACTPPPEFVQKGPGEVSAPFGIAFNNGYLYVGNTASLVRYR